MANSDATVRLNSKEALLDAGEKLFAERGFHGASMREITSLAGVPHGLVTYHFRSKDDLFQGVVSRRSGKIVAMLASALDAVLSAKSSPSVIEIIEAYVGSHISFAAESEAERDYMRLTQMLVAISKRRGLIEGLAAEAMPQIERYASALKVALPDSTAQSIAAAFHLVRLTLAGVLVDVNLPIPLKIRADKEYIRQISAYCAAGLQGSCRLKASVSVS